MPVCCLSSALECRAAHEAKLEAKAKAARAKAEAKEREAKAAQGVYCGVQCRAMHEVQRCRCAECSVSCIAQCHGRACAGHFCYARGEVRVGAGERETLERLRAMLATPSNLEGSCKDTRRTKDCVLGLEGSCGGNQAAAGVQC